MCCISCAGCTFGTYVFCCVPCTACTFWLGLCCCVFGNSSISSNCSICCGLAVANFLGPLEFIADGITTDFCVILLLLEDFSNFSLVPLCCFCSSKLTLDLKLSETLLLNDIIC